VRLGFPIPFDRRRTDFGALPPGATRTVRCLLDTTMLSRPHNVCSRGVTGPLQGMSGVILVRGFSVTNSLYPDQEKRTMREPEVLILQSE
jgi:hypothetical protein